MNGELIRQMYWTHRPALHYSVPQAWMNDPNGLIYINGYYHLFYQYHPYDVIHGPMHWGHARSGDLLQWENLPIALYPDEHGGIFSGSVVYDGENTAGMAKGGICPLVAVFTYHKERAGKVRQSQGIAFSYDGGLTFEKYEGNPVLDEGRVDFRDPKVFRFEDRWIMPLVAGREVLFYASSNLKDWSYLSTFTDSRSEPSGIWECPDLRQIVGENRDERWVLTVSVGAQDDDYYGMQYFVGKFDGCTFVADENDEILMQDIGLDHYAAVSFENVGDRSLQIGWMNCWYYGERIPESGFRGCMTFPRELTLAHRGGCYRILQRPARELLALFEEKSIALEGSQFLLSSVPALLEIPLQEGSNLLRLENNKSDFQIAIDTLQKKVTMDRRGCGQELLGQQYLKPRSGFYKTERCRSAFLILDTTSVELFTADGEISGTMQYFTEEPFYKLSLNYETADVRMACL